VQLEKEFADCSRAFDVARERVKEKMGTSAREEYQFLLDALNAAWDDLTLARAILDNHISEHRCDSADAVGS
jgi:hypothetical protein